SDKRTSSGSHGPKSDLFVTTDKYEPSRAEENTPDKFRRRQTRFSHYRTTTVSMTFIDIGIAIIGGVVGGPDPFEEAGQAPTDGKPDKEVSP
ncbi:9862_t:CDS:1, partial [Acaulospora colombiana]